MADAQVETATITIPGTQTKVPRRTMLLVLGALAVIVLVFLTRRKEEPEAREASSFDDLGIDSGPQPVTLQRIGPGASPGDMTSVIAPTEPPKASTQPVVSGSALQSLIAAQQVLARNFESRYRRNEAARGPNNGQTLKWLLRWQDTLRGIEQLQKQLAAQNAVIGSTPVAP